MHAIVTILAILILLIGLFFTVAPLVPGILIIWAVFLGYGFYDGWASYGLVFMIITAVAAAASLILDYLASVWGAKRFGAGTAGMIGSIIGGILGLIVFSLPGMVLGAFGGAVACEMAFSKQELKEAAQAGAGAIIGLLLGGLAKFIIAITMILAFISMVILS